MNVMQSELRQMHEERFELPDDDRQEDPIPSPDESPRTEEGSVPADLRSSEFLAEAQREAMARKNNRPPSVNASVSQRHDSVRSSAFIVDPTAMLASGPMRPGEHTDEALFQRYQQGDDRAFFSIYERYKSSIYAYCAQVLFSAGMPREVVEDTFQDVFLRLVQYRHTFAGGDFRPWIFTVTRHSCLSAKKRGFKQQAGIEYVGDGVNFEEDIARDVRQAFSSTDDPLERMSKDEQAGLLLAAIARLPEEYRDALLMSEYEGLTYEQIGQIVGASLSTVRIRIFRAKARLRKMLLPLLGEDENGISGGPQQKV